MRSLEIPQGGIMLADVKVVPAAGIRRLRKGMV